MELDDAQLKCLVIIGMTTGLISAISSMIILVMIFRSQDKLSTTFHRIMFALCLSDITSSLAVASSTIPTPKDSRLWLAIGTTETCEMQGFLRMYGGLCTPLYNCGMVIVPMIVIRYNASRKVIRSRVEPILLAFPVCWSTAFGVYFLKNDAFNVHTANCWVVEYPRYCDLSDEVECLRGQGMIESIPYKIIAFVAMIGVPFILVTCLGIIFAKIARNERGEVPSTYGRVFLQRRAFSRMLAYSFTWLLTYAWYLISYILTLVDSSEPFALKVLHYIFFPLQGFFITMVYIHPRYMVMRRLHPNQSFFKILNYALFRSAVIYNRDSNSRVDVQDVELSGKEKEKVEEIIVDTMEREGRESGIHRFEKYEIYHWSHLEDENLEDLIN